MNIATIRAKIEEWLSGEVQGVPVAGGFAGLFPGAQVFWVNRPIGYVREPHFICRLTGPLTNGHDARTFEYVAANDTLQPTVSGNRTLTLSIQVRSFQPKDGFDAIEHTNKIVDSRRDLSVMALFKAAELGFRRVVSNLPLDQLAFNNGDYDNRELSAAELVLAFHAYGYYEGAEIAHVENWGVKSDTLNNPDGTPGPIQIDETMP